LVRRTFREAQWSILILAGSVGAAIGVFFLFGFLHFYDVPFILTNLPSGFGPVETSLEFTTLTFLAGLVGAMGLGLVRAYPPRRAPRPPAAAGTARPTAKRPGRFSWLWRYPAYGFASGYVAAIRGTPFLVQLQIVYYIVIFTSPRLTFAGWDAGYWAGFIALLMNTTGYQAEALRGGFQSVEPGQVEAAKATGLNRLQIFGTITLPQSLRLVTLPLANEWISNFKTATILSYIGIFEVFDWSSTSISLLLGHGLEAFVMLTIFYLLINVTISRVVTYIEKVRRIPGLGTSIPEVGITRRLTGMGSRTR
jgi:ABC-type amino acid transport system permease subunit